MTLIKIACLTSVVSVLVLMMLQDPKPLRIKSTNSNKYVGLQYRIYDSNGTIVSNGTLVVERRSPMNSIP